MEYEIVINGVSVSVKNDHLYLGMDEYEIVRVKPEMVLRKVAGLYEIEHLYTIRDYDAGIMLHSVSDDGERAGAGDTLSYYIMECDGCAKAAYGSRSQLNGYDLTPYANIYCGPECKKSFNITKYATDRQLSVGSKLPKSVIRALKLRIDEAIIKDKKVMDKMRLAHMRGESTTISRPCPHSTPIGGPGFKHGQSVPCENKSNGWIWGRYSTSGACHFHSLGKTDRELGFGKQNRYPLIVTDFANDNAITSETVLWGLVGHFVEMGEDILEQVGCKPNCSDMVRSIMMMRESQ